MGYSDVVTILALATDCDDIAATVLARLALESAAQRLADSAAWSTLASDLVAIGSVQS